MQCHVYCSSLLNKEANKDQVNDDSGMDGTGTTKKKINVVTFNLISNWFRHRDNRNRAIQISSFRFAHKRVKRVTIVAQ